MLQQKHRNSHPRRKQYFCSKPKQKFLAVSQPESTNPSSSECKCSFHSVVQEVQHSTVRISKASSVSANSPSQVFNNQTFQSWIKLKRFDESLQMNVLILHADGCIICLLCSKHPAVTTGRGKLVIFTLPSMPDLNAHTAWIIISALITSKKSIAWKKTQRISLFHAIHQDRISDKVNTVAERIHPLYWVLKEEIANRKIASLQTLMDRIRHNDRFCDLDHDSSGAVTQFILLTLEHLSNRIVSDVKQSPASVVEETTKYCCNVLSIPLPTTWPERRFSTLCGVKTKKTKPAF